MLAYNHMGPTTLKENTYCKYAGISYARNVDVNVTGLKTSMNW